MSEIVTAKGFYGLIHDHLGNWIRISLENGFEDNPDAIAPELIALVDIMADLEKKMKGKEE